MGRWKIGSLTAALGCIALGVILALAQVGVLTYEVLGYLWPALLIMLGLEMLLRLLGRSETKSRTSGWAIVLIVVLGCVSAGQSVLAGGTFGSLLGRSHLAAIEGEVPIKDTVKKVIISIPGGKVTVNGNDGGVLKYDGSLMALGKTKEESQQTLNKNWRATEVGDTVTLELPSESNWLSNITIGLNFSSPYLNVSLPSNLEVTIHTSDGALNVSDLQAGVKADTSNGRIEMKDIQGGVEAGSSNGAILLQQVDGGASVTSSNGAITLEDVGGKVHAKSSNGKIVIHSGISGDWDCKSSNGAVMVTVPKNSDARIIADTSNGSMKGSVDWQKEGDDHGTATIGGGTHTVKLNTSNGSVTADVEE